MSIDANLAVLLQDCLADTPPSRRRSIMTLGRQTIRIAAEDVQRLIAAGALPPATVPPGAPDQEWLFGALGFSEVHSMDVSAYEGCTHLFDLNLPELPAELAGRYDVVFNGGTLEHLFHPTQGLLNALRLLAPGGLFIHAGPVNGWADHGFYQFSPGLLHDYFRANGFECGVSLGLLDEVPPPPEGKSLGIVPLFPGERVATRSGGRRTGHLFSARKLATSTVDRVPKQTMYVARHDDEGSFAASYRSYLECELRDGVRFPWPREERVFAAHEIRAAEDGTFWVPLRVDTVPASTPTRPFRSTALLCEDGAPLPRVVSGPQVLAASGPGHFCHWRGRLLFRTRDGSDPRSNGRRYSAGWPVQALSVP